MKKNIFNFLSLILTACLFASVTSAKTASNDELVIGVYSDYETLNPLLASTAVADYIIRFAYRPMIFLDYDNRFKPLIVKGIPSLKDKTVKIITENEVKKLVATWEFISDLKWGDGHPITCEDMKFAWEVGLNPNVSLPSRDSFEGIESITWDNKTPSKCVVKYKSAKWNFFMNTPAPLPKHLEEAGFKKYGKEREGYDRNSTYQKNPLNKGLWNGPYVVSEAKLGSHVILTPNKFYYGTQPHIKRIIIRIIPNSGTMEANLRSKNIDSISRMGLTLDQAIDFDKKVKSENLPYSVVFQDGVTYAHIDVNLSNPILKDLKVRKALSYGLNKEEIINSVFYGKAIVANHNVAKLDRNYTEDPKLVTIYKPSRRLAKKLLDEAGWKMGSDGYRHKDGKKLSFTLVAAGGAKVNETIQAIIQSQWKTIGVDLQIKSEVARYLFTELLPKRKYDMALYSWVSFPEASMKSVLNS
ncbi:MAG: peptide ABC transporter substrate-binding protein, partial [Bdellovibrionales bacterium]|nr:peptide ABC transporter substrate-binding protein [Bdellovibrionales bacterium]